MDGSNVRLHQPGDWAEEGMTVSAGRMHGPDDGNPLYPCKRRWRPKRNVANGSNPTLLTRRDLGPDRALIGVVSGQHV